MTSTFSTNINLRYQGTGDNVNTWGALLNTDVFANIDQALGGPFTVSVAGSTDYTLSASNALNLYHAPTGILTGNINYIFPANCGRIIIVNNGTTGSFTLTVKSSGGTGVVVPQGSIAWVFLNSTGNVASIPFGVTTEQSIASATTTNIGSTGSNVVKITGTTTITGLGSSATIVTPIYFIKFAAALTLTHDAAALILPGSANITTAANDCAIFEYLGSGNWLCMNYKKADGTAVVGSLPSNNTVTNAFLAQAAAYTVKSNITSATANVADNGISTLGYSLKPHGRLSLTTAVAVMTAGATAQTTVYYVPYIGQTVWVYNGTVWAPLSVGSQLSLALDSNSGHTGYQQSGKLFDLFVYNVTGTATLATGPAWTNSTTRSAAIALQNGIWTNSGTITLKFDATSSTASVTANQATYVGTMYATADGQTGIVFKPNAAAGGSANIVGLDNGYNRIPMASIERDSTASWTYATNTWRQMDNNANNRISWVDGLQQKSIRSRVYLDVADTGTGDKFSIGVNLDATTGAPNVFGTIQPSANGQTFRNSSEENFTPQLGFHFLQAMEIASGGASVTLNASGVSQVLIIDMEY